MVQSMLPNHHNIWCACLFFRALRRLRTTQVHHRMDRIVSIACLPIPSRSLPPPSAAQPLPHRSSSSQTIVQFPGLQRRFDLLGKPLVCFSAVLVYDAGKGIFSRLPVCCYTLWSFLLSILPMTHIPIPWGYPPLGRYGSRGLTMALPPRP